MFCISCGRQLADNLRFCDGCGTDTQPVASGVAGATLGHQFTSEMKARSLDAWEGIKLFAASPVGGLAESFARFDAQRSMRVGFVFVGAYELALLIGLLVFRSRAASLLGGFLPMGELGASELLKVMMIGLVPFASLVGAGALARGVFRGTGGLAGDVYTAGAVLLPSGVLVLAAGLLGAANVEVIAVLALFALTYTILMLYAGCSRIGGISEAGAAPAVPVMLLVSAWLTKVLLTALW